MAQKEALEAQAASKPPAALDPQQLDQCNVFVKYLPPDLDEMEFQRMFKVHGNVVSSKIMIDQATGKSLGYGSVLAFHPLLSPPFGLNCLHLTVRSLDLYSCWSGEL